MYAVLRKDASKMRVLLKHRARVNLADREGMTALMHAADNGCLFCAVTLVSYQYKRQVVNVYAVNKHLRGNFLEIAATRGDSKFLETFLTNPEFEVLYGKRKKEMATLTYFRAMREKNFILSKRLIHNGVDFNHYIRSGGARPEKDKPLIVAIYAGNIDIVNLLLEKGADVNTISMWGDSALHVANKRRQPAIAAILKKRGAKVVIAKPKPKKLGPAYIQTLLRHSKMGNLDQVELWVSRYKDVNLTLDAELRGYAPGKTALMYAAEAGQYKVVKYLLKNGAKKKIKDKRGRTALTYAKKASRKKANKKRARRTRYKNIIRLLKQR